MLISGQLMVNKVKGYAGGLMVNDGYLLVNSGLVGGLEHSPYIRNNHPNWLIFFRGVEATNVVFNTGW